MTDLVYSILKELFEGKEINRQEIDERVRKSPGLSDFERAAAAWDVIMKEKYIEPVDGTIIQDGLALNKISENGRNAYNAETERREILRVAAEEQGQISDLQIQLLRSNILMSDSVISTNNAAVINLEWQRRNGNRTLLFIGLSALFSLGSIISTIALQDRKTPILIEQQTQSLKDIKQSLQNLDKNFQQAVKDSFYKKDPAPLRETRF